MAGFNPYQQYQRTQIDTASPGKLILMLYDGAIRFSNAARSAMERGDLYQKSYNLMKAQSILGELMSCLNMKAGGQIAANLFAIYSYLFDRLTEASLNDDIVPLSQAISHLNELREAWAEAEKIYQSQRNQAPAEQGMALVG
ncbi:MAG: flagellar export chaperone FliS [Armatimonadetes bacterium]|nr:flagellar export chaperone FliS [Armatimonadota bacterium]